jgi:hypothetical protein
MRNRSLIQYPGVDRQRYVFVPDSGSNPVSFYNQHKKKPVFTFQTSVDYLVGVAVEPGGIP